MNEEKKYKSVVVEVTFSAEIEIPEEIADDEDAVMAYADEFGSTAEALTQDCEIGVVHVTYDEDGVEYSHDI